MAASPEPEKEIPQEDVEPETPPPPSYPPYPPYSLATGPPSVADTIRTGHFTRLEHKTAPKLPVRPPPFPAKPRSTKATDVRLTRRQRRAHAQCLRKYKAMVTDRIEQMAKPPRRQIIALWREHYDKLPTHTIAKLRRMLDADEPFKPDQAYEYFINMRKIERMKRSKKKICGVLNNDNLAVCQHKRFLWARDATVAFARGIQRRLLTPGCYNLADGMMRLSNVILNDMCRYMHTRVPSAESRHPRDKLMMEVSDKVACWIDEILSESDDRMLMMDFDEDEDIFGRTGRGPGDTDDFLDMMGDEASKQDDKKGYGKAASKLKGKKLEAFKILNNAMNDRGTDNLISYGKSNMTYGEGSHELKTAPDFTAHDVSGALSDTVRRDLSSTVKSVTPNNLAPHMKEIVDMASDYLAQVAEYNKDKGPAFKLLVEEMKKKPNEDLYQNNNASKTYDKAADDLEHAKGLIVTHEDEALTKEIHSKLAKTMEGVTPGELQKEMKDSLELSSKYLSQRAVDERDKGEAFKILVSELVKKGDDNFEPETEHLKKKLNAGNALKSAEALFVFEPDPVTAPKIKSDLQTVVKDVTPKPLEEEMKETIEKTGNYLSVLNRDGGHVTNGGKRPSGQTDQSDKRAGSDSAVGKDNTTNSNTANTAYTGANIKLSGTGIGEDDASKNSGKDEKVIDKTHGSMEGDKDRVQASDILHKQLRGKGGETFYQQPQTELSHGQASQWLSNEPEPVDKSVKEAGDTARLQRKFERKLSTLVSKVTPPHLEETMQDVTIESARALSEYFVAKSYKTMARDALIGGMQNKDNEILATEDGGAESFFFSAQRLKKTNTFETKEPCHKVSNKLSKKLKEAMRHSSMPRKVCNSVKGLCDEAADYLSESVNKPAPQIEAYVRLLQEMETAGEAQLISGDIPKTYQDSAKYLKQLTTCEDLINRPNSSMKSEIESKLNTMMSQVPPSGYTKSDMQAVVSENAKLLTSYIMLQREKTEALKYLVEKMGDEKGTLLLRHGEVRKSFGDGVEKLRGKNTDQLRVSKADPVVGRKIEIKLHNLMQNKTPPKFSNVMDDVIEDATNYLAHNLLQPQLIQICKCMKNVFVQCELWCDEILRRCSKPCCSCSRHVSKAALQSMAPYDIVHLIPGTTHAVGRGIDIDIQSCPTKPVPCPAKNRTPGCQQVQANYLLLSNIREDLEPTKLVASSSFESKSQEERLSQSLIMSANLSERTELISESGNSLVEQSVETIIDIDGEGLSRPIYSNFQQNTSFPSSSTESQYSFMTVQVPKRFVETATTMGSNLNDQFILNEVPSSSSEAINYGLFEDENVNCSTGAVSTDEMTDWHAMMVSLMWNVKTWQNWLQDIIERILSYKNDSFVSIDETKQIWERFFENVYTETFQWLQYNIFIRQLSLRLDLRYNDKKTSSSSLLAEKTESYKDCQNQMLKIYDILKQWTQRIHFIMKEVNALEDEDLEINSQYTNIYDQRWCCLKKYIQEIYNDWLKSSVHVRGFLEHKYGAVMSEWVGACSRSAPVWVVCAGGAVPCGAVRAGTLHGEPAWVARTTHRGKVLPAALVPSQQCCLVYADSQVYRYSHYQVICNADVEWLAYRAGPIVIGAVRVAPDVHIGRVLYRGSHLIGAVKGPSNRCHVVIFGRPFAFNCFELLILANGQEQ